VREQVRFGAESVPRRADFLHDQGLPEELSRRVSARVDAALALYAELAEPRAVFEEVSAEEFARVYRGEGRNERTTPLDGIYPRAERLALFAATVGEPVSARITSLFGQTELATGFLLNAVASCAADTLAALAGERFGERLARGEGAARPLRVLAYSPGYCGWHLSGQGALFARLRPEEIGITLNDRYLMQPLKSVSGVLVAGSPEIHAFGPDFPFCEQCTTRSCELRMAAASAG
jgi:hypothetical protein